MLKKIVSDDYDQKQIRRLIIVFKKACFNRTVGSGRRLWLNHSKILVKEEENLATHQSAIKRIRQNQRRKMRNRSIQSAFKTRIKKVLKAVETKEVDQVEKALREASSAIASAASKGIIHRNTASRKISRLALRVNALQK